MTHNPRAFPDKGDSEGVWFIPSGGVSYKLQGLLVSHMLQTWIDN